MTFTTPPSPALSRCRSLGAVVTEPSPELPNPARSPNPTQRAGRGPPGRPARPPSSPCRLPTNPLFWMTMPTRLCLCWWLRQCHLRRTTRQCQRQCFFRRHHGVHQASRPQRTIISVSLWRLRARVCRRPQQSLDSSLLRFSARTVRTVHVLLLLLRRRDRRRCRRLSQLEPLWMSSLHHRHYHVLVVRLR